MKKIKDLKTITEQVGDSTDNVERFDRQCRELIKEGWELYGSVQITYSPMPNVQCEPGKPWQSGGFKSLTQQFVKYED